MAVTSVVVSGDLAVSGDSAFTSSGFGTPDAALIFATSANSSGNPYTTAAYQMVGFWTASAQNGVVAMSRSAQGTMQTRRASSTSSALSLTALDTSDINIQWTASATTDGIILTKSGVSTTLTRKAVVVLIKGATAVKAGTIALGTGTSAIDVTGLGSRADLVFLSTIRRGTTDDATEGAFLSTGVAQIASSGAVTQGCVSITSQHNSADSDSYSQVRNDAALSVVEDTGTVLWSASVGAHASGFTITPTASASSSIAFYLALDLPNATDAYVTVKDTNTSTGSQAYTGVGFDPQSVMHIATMCTAVNTVTDGWAVSFGAGGPDTVERSVGTCDEDAQATSDSESYYSDTLLSIKDHGGTTDCIASLTSLDSDGWTLNYTDAAAAATKFLVVAIGDSGTAGGTGTLSKTLDALTLVSTGELEALSGSGSLDKTLDALTLASTGELAIAGTLTKTLDALTLVSTGAGESITLSSPSDRGTLDIAGCSVTPGSPDTIELKCRWDGTTGSVGARLLYGSVTGLDGKTPNLQLLKDGWDDSVFASTHKFLFSYDGETWSQFDNRSSTTTYWAFSHGSAFTSDTVYIASWWPWQTSKTLPWIESLESSGFISDTPSTTDYVFETRSATVNEDGDVITSTPLYGFKISSGSGNAPDGKPKRVGLMVSGVHASEDVGNWNLKGAVDFLVSADAQAVILRNWFDFYVYPVVASAGRKGAGTRGDYQSGYMNSDINRAWAGSTFETLNKHKTAIIADIGAKVVEFGCDFHGSTDTSTPFFYVEEDSDLSTWDAAIEVYRSGIDSSVSTTSGTTKQWIDSQFSHPSFTLTAEHPYNLVAGNLASAEDFGADIMRALSDITDSAYFATPIEGVLSKTLDALTLVSTGELALAPGTGLLNKTLDALTCASTGKLAIGGTASIVLDAMTASGTAQISIKGVLSKTLDSLTLTATGSVPAEPGTGTLTPETITAIAYAVWDTELETGYTAREMMRIMFASLAGKRAGLGTATEYYYDVATGLVPRVIFTPDINGNGVPVVDGS